MTGKEIIASAEVRDVRVSDRTLWRHVILKTKSGAEGVGEATLENAPSAFSKDLSSAAKSLVGRRLDSEILVHLAVLLDQDVSGCTIHSALDQAVTDLRAQAACQPIHAFVSKTADVSSVPLYANINRATRDRSPDGFAKNARAAIKQGFGALKLAPFDGVTPANCTSPEGRALVKDGVNRIRAVADQSGGADIMVDCHWRFTPDATVNLIDELAELGVVWLECPLPETLEAVGDLVRLRARANERGMRLAGLETFAGWHGFAPFVKEGAYDVVMPDIKHAGSYAAIIEISENASRCGVTVSPHNPTGPVAHLASVHLAAALGGAERLEIQWNESELFFCLTDPPPRISDGRAEVSHAPGLGARLRKTPDTELDAG